MKSSSKLVGALLVSALTFSSVYPVGLEVFASIRDSVVSLCSDAASSNAANMTSKVVHQFGRSVTNNPVKAGAAVIAVGLVADVGYTYCHYRNKLPKARRAVVLAGAIRRTYHRVIAGYNSVVSRAANSVRQALEFTDLGN